MTQRTPVGALLHCKLYKLSFGALGVYRLQGLGSVVKDALFTRSNALAIAEELREGAGRLGAHCATYSGE